MYHICLIQSCRFLSLVQRVLNIPFSHAGTKFPGDDVATVIDQDRAEIEPTPAGAERKRGEAYASPGFNSPCDAFGGRHARRFRFPAKLFADTVFDPLTDTSVNVTPIIESPHKDLFADTVA